MITVVTHRVNYSETDQMGVVYHARCLVWFDVARTEHLRSTGVSYRDIEARGVRLAVSQVRARYLRSAHYDDLLHIRCWVRDAESRRVWFGYAVEDATAGLLLVTGDTQLVSLNDRHQVTRLPEDILARLAPIPDPVRL